MTKFDRITDGGRRVLLGVSYATTAGPKHSPIFGFLSIYAYTGTPFNTERPCSARSHMGRGVLLGVSHPSHPKRMEPSGVQCLGFSSIYVYTLRHRMTLLTNTGRGAF